MENLENYGYFCGPFKEGYEPSWILPPNLKWSLDSGRFMRLQKPQPTIEQRHAFKNYLGAYTMHNMEAQGA